MNVGVQVKLWDPLRTRAIPERLRGVITIRRYTNPSLLLPLTSHQTRNAPDSIFLVSDQKQIVPDIRWDIQPEPEPDSGLLYSLVHSPNFLSLCCDNGLYANNSKLLCVHIITNHHHMHKRWLNSNTLCMYCMFNVKIQWKSESLQNNTQ